MFNSLEDIEFIDPLKELGEGAFSHVFKVRLKRTGEICALKKVDVARLSKHDCDNLRNEIKIHKSVDHPFIVKFIDCIQIGSIVYILLECASNGSLFHYIHPRKGLPEEVAFRFLYQTALGVKYLHDRNIIHRDLKPENVLLDDGLNIKICDFGWSATLEGDNLRNTICGTLEYMPPEVVNEKTHNSKVDLWCLGVMLFEMLHGKSPFQANSLIELKSTVKEDKIVFKSDLSENAQVLILGLLNFDSDKRMDIDELISHPVLVQHYEHFFAPIDKNHFEILLQNFYDLKFPKPDINGEIFQKPLRIIEVRVIQGNESKIIAVPVPDNVGVIQQSVLTINSFVAEERLKIRRRNSASIAESLHAKINAEQETISRNLGLSNCLSRSIIKQAIQGRMGFHPSGKVILLERKINWKDEFYEIENNLGFIFEIIFVIYFDGIFGMFVVEVVPYQNEKNVVRKLIKKDFRGKKKEQLKELTNLPDFEFCHITGVKAGCRSLLSASLVADLSL